MSSGQRIGIHFRPSFLAALLCLQQFFLCVIGKASPEMYSCHFIKVSKALNSSSFENYPGQSKEGNPFFYF